MKRPVWNVWSAMVCLGMFAWGYYFTKLGKTEIGGTITMAALAFAAVTERKQKPFPKPLIQPKEPDA